MPSFRKRGDNWEYRIQYYDTTGKRREKAKGGFRTKAEAKLAADYAAVDVQEGHTQKIDKKMTVSKYLDIWFELYKPTVKVSSHRNRATSINQINNVIGDVLLVNLTNSFYQETLNKLSKKYAKNTLLSIHAVMGMMMKQAIKDGYFKENIIRDVRLPKTVVEVFDEDVDDEEIVFWEQEDIVGFHNHFDTYFNSVGYKRNTRYRRYLMYEKQRDFVMIMTGLYAGLRIGEICALKMSDVNIEEGLINVNKTYLILNKQLKSDFTLGPPKTKASRRVVPMTNVLIKEFRKMLNYQKEYKMMFRKTYNDDGFVFTDNTGHPTPPRNMRYRLDTVIGKAGIKEITPHGLRHSYTALLIESDVPIKLIQKRLGHSDIKTTLNIYAHVSKNVTDSSNDKMNETLDNMLSK
ncbi:MAG: site-specific integrase [Prevotellaceae bacterium]|nr:site-specific integrase [Candidatus Colivivens equi]